MKMKKLFKIAAVILCLFLVFRLVNPNITKNIKVLDCTAQYHLSVFGRPYEGYNYHNGKMDIAKCLCEKYTSAKDKKYVTGIREILNEFDAYASIKDDSIEDICKNGDSVFTYWYYE